MVGILRTRGPVCVTESVKNTSMALRYMKAKHYVEAAAELERLSFGRLVTVSLGANSKGAVSQVFVKKPPLEVEQTLSVNPDMCTPAVYAERYSKQPSKAVGLTLRAKLVTMRLVPKKLLT